MQQTSQPKATSQATTTTAEETAQVEDSSEAPFKTLRRKFEPRDLSPKGILALQRTVGNQAVMGLLGRKNSSEGHQCSDSCKHSLQRRLSQPQPIVDPAIQRTPVKMTVQEVALKINVSDGLLDEGSKLLKKLAATRPAKVNDAGADKLSNCALTTMAAITGGATSGQLNDKRQADQGITASSGDQSQRTWAMTLLDLETLAASNMVGVTSERAKNKSLVKDFEDFGEGNAFIVGDAQYYGMLQYLLNLAKTEAVTNPDATFKVYEHGEPGNQMEDEATMLGAMAKYPNGTRFAVFLYSDDPDKDRHVKAHWVYAQKFNGEVIFQDYQTNSTKVGGVNPVDSYLNSFPFSPDKARDKNKTFEQGSFIAYVPTFSGATPVIGDGLAKEVDAEAVTGVIVGVKDKIRALRGPIETPGSKMSDTWSPLGTPITNIPAPSVIESGVKALGGKFGITPVCQFGSLTKAGIIQIIGSPVHESAKKLKKRVGPDLIDYTSDNIRFDTINATMPVKKPGQAAALDTAELPISGGADNEADYRQAFSKSYQISAQVTDKISINASNSEFTDLIHEATHSFEKGTLPMHFREGLADLFASMVAQEVQQTASDDSFEYSYNPSYTPFVVAMQQMADIVGLPTLAKLYFDKEQDDQPGFLIDSINALVPKTTTPTTPVETTVGKLLGAFPTAFQEGMSELRSLSTSAPTLTTAEDKYKTDVYDTRKVKFDKKLNDKLTSLEKKYNFKAPTGASDLDKAGLVDTWDSNETAEKRLKILYEQKAGASGQQFIQLMALIGGHESSISAATGEDTDTLRARILPAAPITFGVHYVTKPGENLFVTGEINALGNWDVSKAKPLTWSGEGKWRVQINLAATAMSLSYKYLVKSDSGVVWETGGPGKHHNKVLPSSASPTNFIDTWNTYS